MTQKWMDEAFVVGLGRFREVDMWVRLITRQKGALSVFAFGGAKSRRRFAGCLDLFNELRVSIAPSKRGQFAVLQESVLQTGTKKLREDPSRLGMMLNCVKFLDVMEIGADSSQGAFLLLQSMRGHFEQSAKIEPLWPMFFRMRAASAMGYALRLHECGVCGETILHDTRLFHLREGYAVCRQCPMEAGMTLSITRRVADALMLVQRAKPEFWGYAPKSFLSEGDFSEFFVKETGETEGIVELSTLDTLSELEGFEKRLCVQLIDGFVQYHLGIMWDKGRFVRQ